MWDEPQNIVETNPNNNVIIRCNGSIFRTGRLFPAFPRGIGYAQLTFKTGKQHMIFFLLGRFQHMIDKRGDYKSKQQEGHDGPVTLTWAT